MTDKPKISQTDRQINNRGRLGFFDSVAGHGLSLSRLP